MPSLQHNRWRKSSWLRNKDIGEKIVVENIDDLIDKDIKGNCKTNNSTKQNTRQYKRHWSEIIDDEKFMYSHENVVMPTIMCCRVLTPKAIEFRSELRLKQNDIVLSKEQSVISKIIFFFSNEKVLLKHSGIFLSIN